jgi:hypothetical protein
MGGTRCVVTSQVLGVYAAGFAVWEEGLVRIYQNREQCLSCSLSALWQHCYCAEKSM